MLGVQLNAAVCDVGGTDTPAPDRLTAAGDPAALLVIETLPVAFPAAPGVNCTPTVTLCVGVSVTADPPLVIANPLPASLIKDTAMLALPVFVIVKSCTVDELPTFTFPKLRLPGLTDNVTLDVVPVPLNGIANGEFGALLVIVSVPVAAPAATGANFTVKFALPAAAKVIGSAIPLWLNSAPVSDACVIVRLAVPVFLTCTVWVFVVPSDTEPKVMLAGVTLNCGVPTV